MMLITNAIVTPGDITGPVMPGVKQCLLGTDGLSVKLVSDSVPTTVHAELSPGYRWRKQ